MTIPQELQTAVDELNKETNAVADTVASLDALVTTAMSPQDVDTVKGKLAEVSNRLRQIASDPNAPVPPGPPPAPAQASPTTGQQGQAVQPARSQQSKGGRP